MRVFVLGTGRCGTLGFARACSHIANFSAGHETRAGCIGDARFAYPEQHIEVDSRLTWFLGELGERFPTAFYVHLRRDPEATARSICRKWGGGQINFARAFGHAIVMHGQPWPDRMPVSRFQVQTAVANIRAFLDRREHMTVWMEDAETWWPVFLSRIGAVCNVDVVKAEWAKRHNKGKP